MPSALGGLRIALLADLHAGSPFINEEKLQAVVQKTNAAQADIILMAGDFTQHEGMPPEAVAALLHGLKAPLGVWAVLGNHDIRSSTHAAFEKYGLPVLADEVKRFQRGDGEFWLAGISDYWTGQPNIEKIAAALPADAFVIAFTHNPDIFAQLPASFGLTLAGHTHGGQVYLPLVGRPVVPSGYGERYAIGHVIENGKHLFVTPGIGTSIIPVRFLVTPEISILTLRRG